MRVRETVGHIRDLYAIEIARDSDRRGHSCGSGTGLHQAGAPAKAPTAGLF
jgi:hypothetical protein